METVFLGLGTNLGEREENLRKAVLLIEEHIGKPVAESPVYETEPWGFTSEISFLNMAVKVETDLSPSGLLGRTLMIEAMMGRLREGKGYKSRIIDIDILLFGSRVIETRALQIPHPRLHERRFVLVPLSGIASDTVHPVLGKSIGELLAECRDGNKVAEYRKNNL
ncbi:MAG TPA: 2-amino-4-hydroxy-6-hydroxymethyldihydropteridine diphosphokinase [Bacteroidales bacterium]|jgi:2-amino-4-hydroxy-6-hydroxymethyldihydropteridine diphosphokinase|nr:2-amino-4-hydroxy-6-hydroxymethyldihydropteridine diphosphokinase [Bacteroidales bacterium]HOS71565.1 2-amino-4-hydroxy-6-hydroxymethyldihydropteridine diphosphokinase [Bacteroidales bacterium]HQH24590.1 2-amino-4-hydroxy-6-hydroxymethyldihydropteridine diphosphokinase [Bacteroidales bacterium]HQJ82518.1 2-amino-4-hydroxy-6-hydroxymethyldihydropteridine diphosphokinase [Bacteroidales bacterium]